jgi:hypothetical protein
MRGEYRSTGLVRSAMIRSLAVALVLVVQACATSSPADPPPALPTPAPTPTPTPAPRSPEPAPAPPSLPTGPGYPVGAIDIACTVRAEIEAVVTADAVQMKLVLMNLGAQEAKVTLKGRCPGGPVELGGLPAGFDPMHTCQAGACASPNATTTYAIPGGRKTVVIGETTLRAKGDACNQPWPLGSTFLQANIETEPKQLDVCSGAQVHIIRDHNTGKLRRANLIAEPVPAIPPPVKQPAPATPKTKPAPVTPPRTKQCPVCGFACTNGGVPSSRRDANGCPVCACDNPF